MQSFIPYGTAGFRMKGSDPNLKIATEKTLLYLIAEAYGFLDEEEHENRFGVMITASHNPVEDNGLKVMNSKGEMWPKELELQNFVNDPKKNINTFKNVSVPIVEAVPTIVVGYDTRPSCATLLTCVRNIVKDCEELGFKVNLKEFGVCTTPELHWTVKEWNLVSQAKEWNSVYRFECAKKVSMFAQEIRKKHGIEGPLKWFLGEHSLSVDSAYGCGGVTLKAILSQLNGVEIGTIINEYNGTKDDQKLNNSCGAEYVQKDQKFPCQPSPKIVYASFDGDADRIVFSFLNEKDNSFTLIDGDKIATLFATFVKSRLDATELNDLSVGVVQTAYANGASTKYLSEKVFGDSKSIVCAATGVKHLHKRAHDFDIGIYFEANGHGTVLFSEKCHQVLELLPDNEPLKLFSNVINQAVGDAIMDMFAVLLVLSYMNLSIVSWSSLYTDFYSLTTKLVIPDRSLIKTTSDERRIIEPKTIQDAIDSYLYSLNVQDARTFVRPSGTEDVVRIYAEATDKDIVASIERNVRKIVQEYFEK